MIGLIPPIVRVIPLIRVLIVVLVPDLATTTEDYVPQIVQEIHSAHPLSCCVLTVPMYWPKGYVCTTMHSGNRCAIHK